MAHFTLTVDTGGKLRPLGYTLHPGDEVTVRADADDVVICISDDGIFGAGRYEIPQGEALTLVVRHDANQDRFDYLVETGDLDASCEGDRGEGGAGRVGGRGD